MVAADTTQQHLILCGKGTEVADALNIPGFKASNGWLHDFTQRHNIRYKIVCSESGDHGMIHSLKAKYKNVLVQSTSADIEGKNKLKLNILQAIHEVVAACNSMSREQ
jgi:Tc5 transposase DNA-binding domain.